MSRTTYKIGSLVIVRAARDPFHKQVAKVVVVYNDGGLLLRFSPEVSEHLWPYSPRHVRRLKEVV